MSRFIRLSILAGIISLSACTINVYVVPTPCGPVIETPTGPMMGIGPIMPPPYPRSRIIIIPQNQASLPRPQPTVSQGVGPLVTGKGAHGCAIFGGNLPGLCDSYPQWTVGQWQPPANVKIVHVLLAGGGGGGSANLIEGMGGPGGGSGKVVTAAVPVNGKAVAVDVGQKGPGGASFQQGGADGQASIFDTVTAAGGGGGQPGFGGTANGAGGNDGGGGAGGGTSNINSHAGAGGAGGSGGSDGQNGQAATDPVDPVQGTPGGAGTPFPSLGFTMATISPGSGGKGGAFGYNTPGPAQFDGGGGGGGGGILINQTGNQAMSGSRVEPPCAECGVRGQSGDGGSGYGAGGGGSGNGMTTPGGDGANGVVYLEW